MPYGPGSYDLDTVPLFMGRFTSLLDVLLFTGRWAFLTVAQEKSVRPATPHTTTSALDQSIADPCASGQ
jgi:hypothetical protein